MKNNIFDSFILICYVFCHSSTSHTEFMYSLMFACVLKLYFASTSQKTIERVDLSDGSRDILVSDGLDSPEGLAIDWVHRRMYWTDTRHVVLVDRRC